MKPVIFKSNPRALGYREIFRVAGPPVVGLLACALKLFRVIGPENDGYGMRSFGDELERIEIEELPRRVLRATDGLRSKVEKLGFVPGFAYSLETFGGQEAHGQLLRHRNGMSAVSVAYARMVKGTIETETIIVSYNTMLMDDSYLITSAHKRLLNKPASFSMEHMPGASPKEAFDRHMDRVKAADENPRKILTDGDLERLALNCENEETEFNLERGVYVKMPRNEIELGRDLKEQYLEDSDSPGFRTAGRKRDEDDDD